MKITRNSRGISELERDLAIGLYAVALDAETEAKREAPVRGGYRSFQPGSSPIGGTLRRSIHSVGYGADGTIAGQHDEGMGRLVEEVPVPGKLAAYVGTNSGYGAYVELGTIRMPARAFLAPGLDVSMQRAAQTIDTALRRIRPRARR